MKANRGRPGTWVWLGVEDVGSLHEEYTQTGAAILHAPLNYPWAYEMKVQDPDGHVLRFGFEPREDLPYCLSAAARVAAVVFPGIVDRNAVSQVPAI